MAHGTGPTAALRLALGGLLLLLALVVLIAFLQSFHTAPLPGGDGGNGRTGGEGPVEGPGDGSGGGQGGITCTGLLWTVGSLTVALAAAMAVLAALAVRRLRQDPEDLGLAWGAVALGAAAGVSGLAWWATALLCSGADCDGLLRGLGIAAGVLALIGTGCGLLAWRGRPRIVWLAAAVVALVLVLATGVGALVVNGICDPPEPDLEPGGPQEPPDCKEVLRNLGIGAGALTLAAVALGVPGWRMRPGRTQRALKVAAFVIGVLALVLLLALVLVALLCSGTPGGGPPGGGGGAPGGGEAPGDGDERAQEPTLRLPWWLLLVAVALALLVAGTVWWTRKAAIGKDPPPAPDLVPAEEREALLRMLEQAEVDSRDAVVAAYRAFLAWCSAQEHPREVAETPQEHAARVGQRLGIQGEGLRSFVDAYLVARLADRPPSPQERELARRFALQVGTDPDQAERQDLPEGRP